MAHPIYYGSSAAEINVGAAEYQVILSVVTSHHSLAGNGAVVLNLLKAAVF